MTVRVFTETVDIDSTNIRPDVLKASKLLVVDFREDGFVKSTIHIDYPMARVLRDQLTEALKSIDQNDGPVFP